MTLENLVLRSSEIVFGQQADRFKQLRAKLIVKIFGRKAFWSRGETVADFFGKTALRIPGNQIVNNQSFVTTGHLSLKHNRRSLFAAILTCKGLVMIAHCK